MKLSIAMATYNGETYIKEQLESFLNQTRLPDELVVSDDGSRDSTISIMEEFARSAPFQVRLHVNEQKLGYALNFDRAITSCTGDVVFLSDQDDIWSPNKLDVVEAAFTKYSDALLVMNDAEIVDADGRSTGLTKLAQTRALGLDTRHFGTGCCMAIRKSFVSLFSPVPSEIFVHDTWLNRLALILDIKKIIPEVLQHYRRHENNTSAFITSRMDKVNSMDLLSHYHAKDPRPFCLNRIKQLQTIADRLETQGHLAFEPAHANDKLAKGRTKLESEWRAVEARLRVLEKPRWLRPIPAINTLLKGQYGHFSGWKSFAKDLIRS